MCEPHAKTLGIHFARLAGRRLEILNAVCVMTEPDSVARVHACFKYYTSAFQVALSDRSSQLSVASRD